MTASCLGLVLAEADGARARLGSILVLGLGLGLAAGLVLRTEEAGAPRLPAALAFPLEGAKAATVEPLPGSRAGPDDAASFFRITGIEGRLAADSSPSRKGIRSYALDAQWLSLEAPGMRARVSAAGSCRVLLRGGPALEKGSRLKVEAGSMLPARAGGSGGPPAEDPAAFFGDGRRLVAAPPIDLPGRLRHILRPPYLAALEAAGGGGASSGLLIALLSGCRDELDQAESEDFKKAGCAHVLSLSGQHLAILAAALALILKPLGGPRKARRAALALSVLFVFVAGAEPALLRALIMYALATFALLSDRPQKGKTILGLSFAAQIFLDPGSARGLSFQLSYLALAGLVLLAPRFEYALVQWMPPKLAGALAASLAAQAATTPLAAASFGAVYPIGVIASMATAPLVAAFIWWGLAAALACGAAPGLAAFLGPATKLLHEGLARSMAFFAAAPALALGPEAAPMFSAGVVLAAAFVYALPYAEHFRHARLRLAHGPP